jgi:hypothetical protein
MDDVSANHGSGPTSSRASGDGGRPDERFPNPPVTTAVQGLEVSISVVATVNMTKNQGQIRFVNPVQGARASGIAEHSQVMLRVRREGGKSIGEYAVQVKLDSEPSREVDREGLVDAVLRVSSDVRAIELVIGGRIADTSPVGGSLPAVRGVQRLNIDTDRELRFGLVMEGAVEKGHSYYVQVSTDRGKTWKTVGVGLKEPVFAIDRGQFYKGDELQVRVVVTNGLSSSMVSTEAFRI